VPAEPVNPVVLAIGRLQKHFPQAFPKNPAPKVPLKLGVHKDLLTQAPQLGLSEAAVIEAIKTWCWGKRYWACLVEDACRIDLAGQEAGRVLATEAARARGLEARRYRHTKKVAGQQGEEAIEPQQQEGLEQSQDGDGAA
jgi:ProP effector